VNTAALMEANGAPGRINVSETVAGHVKTLLELEPRGPIVAKHGSVHQTFFLNRLKPELSRDPEGRPPNPSFAAECNRLLTGFQASRGRAGRLKFTILCPPCMLA
jgi:adenylate cyclase